MGGGIAEGKNYTFYDKNYDNDNTEIMTKLSLYDDDYDDDYDIDYDNDYNDYDIYYNNVYDNDCDNNCDNDRDNAKIIYDDFLPTPRRSSHVKSHKTHIQSSRYTP